MKSFANIRPAIYKEPPTWSVNEVLKFIAVMPTDWHQINITFLILILAILFALSSAARSSELSNLRLNRCQNTTGGAVFQLVKHKKNHVNIHYSYIVPSVGHLW